MGHFENTLTPILWFSKLRGWSKYLFTWVSNQINFFLPLSRSSSPPLPLFLFSFQIPEEEKKDPSELVGEYSDPFSTGILSE